MDWLNTTGLPTLQTTQIELKVFPNPANMQVKIQISINAPENGRIKIEVLNSLGICISNPYSSTEIAGLHTFEWSFLEAKQPISPGLYYIRVTGENGHSQSAALSLIH